MKFNSIDFDTYFKNYPDTNGYFGKYGGSYIPPELQTATNEISDAYQTICKSRKFIDELRRIRKEFQGRPTPISHLARLSDKIGTGVQLSPAILFVDGHGRIKFIFFIGQTNGVGSTFHQKIVNVQRSGKSVFSAHRESAFLISYRWRQTAACRV